LRVEPLNNGVQSLNAAYCGFEHLQDGSFDGRIADQLRLVDATVLAKDVAVQQCTDSLFHTQNAGVEVVAVGFSGAAGGVPAAGAAVGGSLTGVTSVGLASSICSVRRCGGTTVAIPA